MQKKWIWFIPAAIVGGIAFVAVGGFVVQWLWNWLLPPLFGWHVLSFWQALGMLVLCRILFGGMGRHAGGGKHRRHRDGDRCGGRTPEEREQFRQQMREDFRERMRQRWGTPTPPPGPAPQA